MWGCDQPQIGVKFLEDVAQTSWEWSHVRRDRKGETDRMARRWVGILAHDEYPDFWKGHSKGSKDEIALRKPSPAGSGLCAQSLADTFQGCLMGQENRQPRRMD